MVDAITQRRMLKVPEAALLLGISVAYLNALRCKGGGPQFLKFGRAVAYDPADLEKWAAERRRSSTSDHGGVK